MAVVHRLIRIADGMVMCRCPEPPTFDPEYKVWTCPTGQPHSIVFIDQAGEFEVDEIDETEAGP